MSYLLKIAKNKNVGDYLSPNDVIKTTSKLFKRIMSHAREDNLLSATTGLYFLASFAQRVYFLKNTAPKTIKDARAYADANEYYMETLKEASTVVKAMLNNKFGNLVPADSVQNITTFASEDDISIEKIENHMKTIFPNPRKKTTDKRGKKK